MKVIVEVIQDVKGGGDGKCTSDTVSYNSNL